MLKAVVEAWRAGRLDTSATVLQVMVGMRTIRQLDRQAACTLSTKTPKFFLKKLKGKLLHFPRNRMSGSGPKNDANKLWGFEVKANESEDKIYGLTP